MVDALSQMKPKTQASVENDPRWARVAARDRSADGAFFYGVRTTGVYCRPSCAARLANPIMSVLPACRGRRSGGLSSLQEMPAGPAISRRAVCREGRPRLPDIEAAEDPPSLSALAKAARLSAFHFHRVFKAWPA